MNKSGRAIGMIVFVLGISVLLLVLGTAYQMFAAPISSVFHPNGNTPLNAAAMGGVIAWIIVRITLLFVMMLAGSAIASRGIHLYLGCGSHTNPANMRIE